MVAVMDLLAKTMDLTISRASQAIALLPHRIPPTLPFHLRRLLCRLPWLLYHPEMDVALSITRIVSIGVAHPMILA